MATVIQSPMTVSLMCGAACHVLFNRIEPRGRFTIPSLIFCPPAIITVLYYRSYSNILTAFLASYAIYIGSLVCSTVAYRLSPFHPLAAYPGPIICRVTRLWASYIVQTGNQHRYYKSLHDRYGPYVRTGPNHLQIRDASVLPVVMGSSPFTRSPRYEVTIPHGAPGSLISILDPVKHAQRRRIWDRSMNINAIQGYKDQLSVRIGQLVAALERQQNKDLDLANWLSCLSFDFMGDLAFGGAFQLLAQGSDQDGFMHMSRLAAKFQETAGTIPWVRPCLEMIPSKDDMHRFRKFSSSSVLARKAQGSTRKDIFYYLLDEEEGIGQGKLSTVTLILEAGLAIIAGSDTTGTALSGLFFYLLSNPQALAHLQAEVDHTFPRGADVVASNITSEMKYLNAVINETLRLQPVVPNGVQRTLSRGRGGVMLSGHWIPEGTTVQISAYSVQRDPQYFSPDPDSFCPERWLGSTSKEFKNDASAFFPFSYGPTACAGKNLALMELRLVVCSLIQKFEFEFAPGVKQGEWEKNLRDCFILVKGQLLVRVKVRR